MEGAGDSFGLLKAVLSVVLGRRGRGVCLCSGQLPLLYGGGQRVLLSHPALGRQWVVGVASRILSTPQECMWL